MDKGCHSGDSSNNNSSSNTRDHYLKHLNKISHKISKPIRRNPFDHHQYQQQQQQQTLPPPQQQQQQQQQQNLPPPPQQHQPPVYNINKSDFRDVVQKLTGSPAHDRFSTPPPIHPPKPQSSRLQRIRPPPLAHVSNRPPPPLHNPIPLSNTTANGFINPNNLNNTGFNFTINNGRPIAPLSPLPPFPAVHPAAESPVSAYMRYLQNSATADPESRRFSGLSPLAPLIGNSSIEFSDAFVAFIFWASSIATVAVPVAFTEFTVFAFRRSIRVSTVPSVAGIVGAEPAVERSLREEGYLLHLSLILLEVLGCHFIPSNIAGAMANNQAVGKLVSVIHMISNIWSYEASGCMKLVDALLEGLKSFQQGLPLRDLCHGGHTSSMESKAHTKQNPMQDSNKPYETKVIVGGDEKAQQWSVDLIAVVFKATSNDDEKAQQW
ncbi:hypothetical protein HHK36_031513 [Tetracentron sinense]|uniref:VQ domain-containing protein n=1 Tax=Tetracentron sinense TaxID=13715 RepID=A0A834Y9H4_TETSI|nr:hypothetical protein HHK36_031513 [Tetracentron sinense]